MKKLLAVIAILLSLSAKNQNKYYFYLDQYFELAGNKKPYFVRVAFPVNNYWGYNDYDSKENLVQAGFFTDTFFTKPVGHYVHYKKKEKFYEGNFTNGVPSGTWYFYERGRLEDSIEYVTQNDSPVLPKDSVLNKKNATDTSKLKDTSAPATVVEIEASFKGGERGWVKYVTKCLDYIPELVYDETKPGAHTTTVQFIVCTDGTVCEVKALTSAHPLFDLTAINAIRKGPRWTPAYQKDRNVKAYRRQKITYLKE